MLEKDDAGYTIDAVLPPPTTGPVAPADPVVLQKARDDPASAFHTKPRTAPWDIVVSTLTAGEVPAVRTPDNPLVVTYAFDGYRPELTPEALRADKSRFEQMLGLIEDVTNVDFREVAPGQGANITVRTATEIVGAGEWNGRSQAGAISGVLTIRPDEFRNGDTLLFNGAPDPGEYSFLTILHETMHALGLHHGGSYNGLKSVEPPVYYAYEPDAIHATDTLQYTAMSYFGAEKSFAGHVATVGFSWETMYPSTPQLYDVAALQRLYGYDWTTRADSTTYGFNSTAGREPFDFAANKHPVVTIWDGGGWDALDLSLSNTNDVIDLTPGGFSSYAGMVNNIAIAWGVVIEEVRGGSGNDALHLWARGGVAWGGAGNDILSSRSGGLLFGGAGNDTLVGGTESGFGAGDDILSGGPGADLIYANSGGNDRIVFYRGDDLGVGAAADTIVNFGRAGSTKIDLRAIDAAPATPDSDEAFAFGSRDPSTGGLGNAFGGAGTLRAYGIGFDIGGPVTTYDLILEGDTNGDGAADFQIVFDNAVTRILQDADIML